MTGVHSNWTKPYFVRGGEDYCMEDFELLTTILSALEWQKKGGSIKMLTDGPGAEYFCSRHMEDLWDGGLETALDDMPAEVDPFLFWAAGKLWALKSQDEPVCMVDTDMIVWQSPEPILKDAEIAVAHREEIMPDVYPKKEYFRMREGYTFPDWDWSVRPCNTAFLYIKDMDFKKYYVDRSMEFMTSLKEDSNVVVPMVFAEQRLLSMCAAEWNKPILHLLDQYHLNDQNLITHVWGHKSRLRSDKGERSAFCRRCIARIRRDFPQWDEKLWHIPELLNHLWS